MSTLTICTKPVELDASDDDEYCIEDPDKIDTALCGSTGLIGPAIPDEEVPDEQTCKDCLRIAKERNLQL